MSNLLTSGSSPHTRGARNSFRCCRCCPGDHPRIRGEHGNFGCKTSQVIGIIPAYAGSTLLMLVYTYNVGGSSPHTRGAPTARLLWRTVRGDHPRIRGEHRGLEQFGHGPLGIIPAYAGSTSTAMAMHAAATGSSPHTRGARIESPVGDSWTWDHPRIRGEHWTCRRGSSRCRGSSPHTRGALRRHARHSKEAGIIPAYAGSTALGVRMPTREPGSSPHTRGAPRLWSAWCRK